MKRSLCLLAFLTLCAQAHAATHAVLPGQSIQPKIDAAAPGDVIAIFGGTYPGDISITKAVRLVEVDGQEVTLTGNINLTGVTSAPPFEGFTVGSPGKGITVTNTTGLVIKNLDARPGTGVTVREASTVSVTGGFYSQITQDGGELVVTNAEVTGGFSASVNSLKTVAFRLNMAGDFVWGSQKAWCGYSNATHFSFSGNNALVNVVKCVFDVKAPVPQGDGGINVGNVHYDSYAIRFLGNGNKISVLNNEVYRLAYAYLTSDRAWPYMNTTARGIWVEGDSTSVISNNFMELYLAGGSNTVPSIACGIIVLSPKTKIYGNIIDGAINGINAPFGADVRNNCHYRLRSTADVGGQVPVDSLSADPLFVAGERPKLQPTSPCVNGGVNDPIFNDLDGSRNDIGPGGGCFFDPQGRTTNKPVVISFDIAPQQLLKGVDTQVTISNGQAVAQP